jgi:hypothetical protein
MSHILILTGMHRSATSLVASMFQRAGVHLGAQLLEPNSQNPRGFFEDVEFHQFHETVLRARGKNILIDRTFVFEPTAEEHARAHAILASRAQFELWGWKDPRTSLCLEFWREKIPNAHFLFLYRHPFDVLLSMMRRNEWYMLGLLEGLEAWYAYNRALAAFRAQHPAQTLLCNSYALVDRLDSFNACLQERFGLPIQLDANSNYQASELRRAELSEAAEKILQVIHPDAMALYARLNQLADLPAPQSTLAQSAVETSALAQFADALENPNSAARRGLLFALLGITQPNALETYIAKQTRELETVSRARDENAAQRDAWQQTAEERAQTIREQQAWAQARMNDLEKLEAHPVVRALKKLGGA